MRWSSIPHGRASSRRNELRHINWDGYLFLKLACDTFQIAKRACGEHDDLTREVSNLHKILHRVQCEVTKAPSVPMMNDQKSSRNKLRIADEYCGSWTRSFETTILWEMIRGRRLWQRIRFGNGEQMDLLEIRPKLSAHTTAIMMSLKLYSMEIFGRVEIQLND